MRRVRSSYLAGGGLIGLMVLLFAVAFVLNRRHHDALNTSLDGSLAQFLENQATAQLYTLAAQEQELFALHNTPRELEADLFQILPDRVVPACISELLKTVPAATAEEAFRKGLALLPTATARPFFETAARGPADTPDALYRKISADFNLLEIQPDVQTVCRLLMLLEDSNQLLSPARREFFGNLLAGQEPELPAIRKRLDELWKTADELDQKITRQHGAYHAGFNGRTLSVAEDGLALLYSPKLTLQQPAEISYSRPEGLHREIVPGIYAVLPPQVRREARADIRKQYIAGNIILGGMGLLGLALTAGMLASARRRRELEAMRTEFIATVSHELRTPLSLIRLHAETLKHGRVPESKIDEYHQTILTEAERLTGIVNNVLDFSRMERNKLRIHTERTDLSELTERAADAFNDRLAREGLTLEKAIPPNIFGTADPLAFSQIVFNLLDNAIKYSDGAKSIRIELDEAGGRATLTVADHGIGIPDKLRKHIFEEFVRSDDTRVTARRGSGIGLSVAKRLAEQMGGTIEVADNEPKGSVFTLSVPPASSGLQNRQDGGDTKGGNETTGG